MAMKKEEGEMLIGKSQNKERTQEMHLAIVLYPFRTFFGD